MVGRMVNTVCMMRKISAASRICPVLEVILVQFVAGFNQAIAGMGDKKLDDVLRLSGIKS